MSKRMLMDQNFEQSMEIVVDRERYPYCIVWTPIPLITWLIPLIGHMGIATSNGVINDFAGPYTVTVDNMAFGKPTKYWQLDPEQVSGGANTWDEGVAKAADIYCTRMHNLFCDNCHSHVAAALNSMKYSNQSNYNMVNVWFQFTIHSRYVSFGRFLKTWLPFTVIVILVVLFYVFTSSHSKAD